MIHILVGNAFCIDKYRKRHIVDESRLWVVDVKNPAESLSLGFLSMGDAFLEDITVAGNYAYLAELTDGLIIVEISDPTGAGGRANNTGRCLWGSSGRAGCLYDGSEQCAGLRCRQSSQTGANRVVEDGGHFFSLNNRRLAAAKIASNLLPEREDLLVPVIKLDMDDMIRQGNQGRLISAADDYNDKKRKLKIAIARHSVIVT